MPPRIKKIGFIILLIALWEAFAWSSPKYIQYFPPLSIITRSFFNAATSTEVFSQVLITLSRIFRGYALGILFGVSLGSTAGKLKLFYYAIEPAIELVRPLPSVVLVPIAILVFGVDDTMNIAMIAYASTWPIFINTLEGVRGVDVMYENTGRVFGLGRLGLIRKVIIPAALPFIVTGLRIGLGVAVIAVISSEMIASSKGLGVFLIESSQTDHIPETYGALLIIGLVGYALNQGFRALEGHFMAWHKGASFQEEVL